MNPKIRTIAMAVLFVGLGGALVWRRVLPQRAVGPTKVSSKSKLSKSKSKKTEQEPTPLSDGAGTKAVAVKAPAKKQPDPRLFGLRGQILHRLDRNGDSLLDPSELPPKYRTALAAVDSDGDKKLNAPEFILAIDSLSWEEEEKAPSPGGLATPPPVGTRVPVYAPAASPNAPKTTDPFRGRDKDGDGQLGLYEWPGGKVNDFHRMDVNGDGFISLEEFQRSSQAKGPGGQTALVPGSQSSR